MSATKVASLLFAASTNVPAGTLRTAPVIGNVINMTTAYGGMAYGRITNGASAPGVGCTIEFQASPDNVLWTFMDQIIGDVQTSANGGGGTGTVPVGVGVGYLRAIAYGNTTTAVTVDGQVDVVTGL